MKRYPILFLLATIIGLSSCQDVIDVKLDQGPALLAVDGYITNQPGPYTITISKTAAYFTNAATPRVSGALVTITDNEGTVDTLMEVQPGNYVTKKLQGKIGNNYQLRIKAEGQEYTAQAQIMDVPKIDSLMQEFKEKTSTFDEGYYIQYFGQELQGEGDYYRFKIYKNDTLLNKPEDLTVTDDSFVDGNYISGIVMNDKPFKVGDKIRVETCTLNEDNYYFFSELSTQINNGGIFANPPANVRTNIINVDPKGPKAVGYFGGMGVSGFPVNPDQTFTIVKKE